MAKETFLFGFGSLVHIIDRANVRIEMTLDDVPGSGEREFLYPVGKGVVFYNRKDVLAWALEEQKELVLLEICEIAVEEGRIDLLEEVWNHIEDEDVIEDIFEFSDYSAARGGKLNVLKWLETKGLGIDNFWCVVEAARYGHLNILKWLQEIQDLELYGGLYNSAIEFGDHLHVMKWLREQGCPWDDCDTFKYAANKGNLDILEWLHDEGCPWPEDDDDYRVSEEYLKPEVVEWLRANGYSNRILF
eukprot:CAMPEP_0178968212 /NCGR_PEP_ID=MMETSP0789-20121207/18079_1 /TAXON_ID=3005 /ORGANISM="Rhizosolenia setigera, Strain CCMP 1694" /LENGTH=245 /DNA_ID=CAMNT_0020654017 /DNA_START=216 /DNA_END=950 /DNA_ORIENTATION=+